VGGVSGALIAPPSDQPPAGAQVHIVDDDPAIRDSLAFLFRSRGLSTFEWDSGDAFLAAPVGGSPACVVLDVRMAGMSGPEVFDRLRQSRPELPVVFLTGHAEVPVAVEAIKRGAFDFVEKPFNNNLLVETVIAALAQAAVRRAEHRDRDLVAARLASLTAREREVLDLLLGGRLNKQIAEALGVTMRTVEVHRARVFDKMGVRNAVELANLLSPLSQHPAPRG
jgi:two-component system, LuxR family, response regulator DctR